jgi:hypothetical protein
MPRDSAEIGIPSALPKHEISRAVVPGRISGVVSPLIRLWTTCPTFLKTNVTEPGFANDMLESLICSCWFAVFDLRGIPTSVSRAAAHSHLPEGSASG